MMEALLRSNAWIAIVMITDLLRAQRSVQCSGHRRQFELDPAFAA